MGKISQEQYINESIVLDNKLYKLSANKSKLLSKIPLFHKKEVVEISLQNFCDDVKIRLERLTDFDSKKRFLQDYTERVIYNKYEVRVIGSVPLKNSEDKVTDKISFEITDKINKKILHSRPRQKFSEDGRLKTFSIAST